jgi:hypothetical protein
MNRSAQSPFDPETFLLLAEVFAVDLDPSDCRRNRMIVG